jgi:hypothetical protein
MTGLGHGEGDFSNAAAGGAAAEDAVGDAAIAAGYAAV